MDMVRHQRRYGMSSEGLINLLAFIKFCIILLQKEGFHGILVYKPKQRRVGQWSG